VGAAVSLSASPEHVHLMPVEPARGAREMA